MASLLVLAACSSGGGGVEDPVESFALDVQPTDVQIVAGGSEDVTLGVTRDAGFEGAVAVSVSGLPDGVTAETLTIAADANTGTLVLNAGADAAVVTDAEITVTGTSGDETDSDTFSLDVVAAAPASGDPDPAFGTDGMNRNVFLADEGVASHIHDIELLADGSILVAGTTNDGTMLMVAQVGASGELVTGFGTDGVASGGAVTGTVDALDMMLDAQNGAIRVAAVTEGSGGAHFFKLFEFAYGVDGTADGTLVGTPTEVNVQDAINALHASGVTAETFVEAHDVDFVTVGPHEGKILVAGEVFGVDPATNTADSDTDFGVLQFTAAGALDDTFSDSDGVEVADMGGTDDAAYGVEVLPQSENYALILFGAENVDATTGLGSATVVRVTEGGDLVDDDTFGSTADALDLSFDAVYDAVAVTDGDGNVDVVVAGVTTGAAGEDMNGALARFDATTGQLDSGFGVGGEMDDDRIGSETFTELAVQGDMLVAAGTVEVAGATNLIVARYAHATGEADAAFGDAGHALAELGGVTDATVDALAVDADDVAIGGSADGDATLAVFVY